MQAANFYTVDIEKHSMGVGLRCWPTNQDYNNGKDCSASVATHANEAAGAGDLEVHCSADSLHQGSAPAGTAAAAAGSESPQDEPCQASAPQVEPCNAWRSQHMQSPFTGCSLLSVYGVVRAGGRAEGLCLYQALKGGHKRHSRQALCGRLGAAAVLAGALSVMALLCAAGEEGEDS